MIGPSAPNGPPDPMEMADESGLRTARRGSTRLPLIRIASMRFGDAVAANALRAVARHEADDERADDGTIRTHRCPDGLRRARPAATPAPQEKEVGEQADQFEQGKRHIRADNSDDDGDNRHGQDASICGKISERVPDATRSRGSAFPRRAISISRFHAISRLPYRIFIS